MAGQIWSILSILNGNDSFGWSVNEVIHMVTRPLDENRYEMINYKHKLEIHFKNTLFELNTNPLILYFTIFYDYNYNTNKMLINTIIKYKLLGHMENLHGSLLTNLYTNLY